MLRQTVYALITGDSTVTDVVPAWYDRSAVLDTPETPYGVLGWEPELAKGGRRWTYSLNVYVHDNRGDFNRIDAALKAVRALLEGTLQYTGLDGTIVQADYRGTSGDQVDQATGTNVKFSSWEVVGRA
jgi:hypothetical protein